jgi:hypothetical protein
MEHPVGTLSFSEALEELKFGRKVQRDGWNGKNVWIVLNFNSIPVEPYIYMNTTKNNWVVWTASQTDILTEDWSIV